MPAPLLQATGDDGDAEQPMGVMAPVNQEANVEYSIFLDACMRRVKHHVCMHACMFPSRSIQACRYAFGMGHT